MRDLRAVLVACGLVAVAIVGVQAALPTFWQVSTEAEFLQGDIEDVSIDAYGRLTLGPGVTPRYESSAPFLWALASAPDGSVFVGSGNEGQVYRIDADGNGTVFFDADELEVHAIAPAPGGGLYVATSPDGQIYKVDETGTGQTFFDPEDRYIWSLAVDADGNVFAGTGDTGVVYKISPDGQGAPFYRTKATHVMTLAFDGEGRLLAGTASPGRVFQIDGSGRPFVLLDSPFDEIHTVRVRADGEIYVAAVRGRATPTQAPTPAPAQTPAPVQQTASVSTDVSITIVSGGASTSQSTSQPAQGSGQGPGAGAVYRILPNGAWDLIWQMDQDAPYDLAFENGGSVMVATGNEGKIYRLSGEPMLPTLVARAPVQQVTALLSDGNAGVQFATSNPGKLFRLSADRAERGTYTSDVRDAQASAAWGAIKWAAQVPDGARLGIATRSGNTETPDETWSEWSPSYANAAGSTIVSPRARYLQWRAVLTGSSAGAPVLTSVTAAYLPRNTRPRVTDITIHPPGTVFQRPFPTGDPGIAGFEGDTPDQRAAAQSQGGQVSSTSAPSLGRQDYQKGLLTFVWRAEDTDQDELRYDVQYRREGDTAWKPLRRELAESLLVWDTTSVPNGRYTIQVVASDVPSNAPDTVLTATMESTTFEIDNTPPSLTVTAVRREGDSTVIAFDVRDEDSAIQKAEYSMDGDRWHAVYPTDGIADSRTEAFELTLDAETAAGVVIRVTDALSNTTSARGDVPTTTRP
ncbi:MAG: SMP-30/gluconolactonase/LRE family protein [Acidobacteria bacterium]|nr:SMP-30/gluconolactonase/LRE family protein [Acidobacteriota bacterium]